MTMLEQVAAYQEDLDLFETPNEKLEYIYEIGHTFVPMDPKFKTPENIIHGCASQAWLNKRYEDGVIYLEADADSLIAHGMLVLLLALFSKRTPDEILSFDPHDLDVLGFNQLLTPVRLQGMEAFLNVIYTYANQCKEA
jgi:cysteine desulfuration protein SufE